MGLINLIKKFFRIGDNYEYSCINNVHNPYTTDKDDIILEKLYEFDKKIPTYFYCDLCEKLYTLENKKRLIYVSKDRYDKLSYMLKYEDKTLFIPELIEGEDE
jgi:hypothetical protein